MTEEGNRNYGENLMLFDQLFGTFFLPSRRPPADIGIRYPMPPRRSRLSERATLTIAEVSGDVRRVVR